MKKELAHREEQARQKQPIRRVEGQSSKAPQQNAVARTSRSQAIGSRDAQYRRNPQWGHRGPPRGQYPYHRGRFRGYSRGRGRWYQPQNKKTNSGKGKGATQGKGATPSVHSRVVFPSYRKTCPKGIPFPAKLDKGNAIAHTLGADKDKDADLDEEYFEEGDDEMVRTISIISTEYLGEYEGDPEEDYNMDAEEAFSFIRYEDELGYFLRPSEKQKSHLFPLHITTTLSGIKVNKVLIDGGAATSLLPERMLMKLGKHPDDLVPTNIALHVDFSVYSPKLKPLNVNRVLNSYNCEGCYLSSESLTVKLRHPHLTVLPTGWDCSS
ncbi:hypothetical protein Ahy_B08g093830 isoform B [Arachis hypogaea]|uniref:Aspartic peptidase DDI1-type domain-containing protein n=1 Tax=Arachis hypogaea TaxID=3818 RepID=A0A444Y743_ARAHY|nr:hypothetical protein Ahy_B08g093830 isoform B [Arachis hypogaea]